VGIISGSSWRVGIVPTANGSASVPAGAAPPDPTFTKELEALDI